MIKVKQGRFPVSLFFIYYGVLFLVAGVHTGIIVMETRNQWNEIVQVIFPMFYWAIVAAGITWYTSAPNPQDYREVFLYIHDRWPEAEILHLCYSAVTSCSYQNAVLGSEDLSYVKHMDSKNVTAGQASVVLRAARYIEENPEITTDELIPEIEKWIRDSCMVFVPGNLEYLRAGGRVSNAAYLGASILSLKPLIEIQDRFVKVGNNE